MRTKILQRRRCCTTTFISTYSKARIAKKQLKDEKRMIRRSAALFFVKDGLLFRKDELRKEGKQ